MFHKEGFTIIIVSFMLIAVAAMLADQFIGVKWLRITLQLVLLVFLVLILQFFRNPDRPPLALEDAVVSPVDGKVVIVTENTSSKLSLKRWAKCFARSLIIPKSLP